MQVSVILAHPDPASFNHGIARVVLETLAGTSARVNFHDLYKEQFEPLLPAEEVARDVILPGLAGRSPPAGGRGLCAAVRESIGSLPTRLEPYGRQFWR